MTNAVLYSLPKRINEPTRFITFKRRLIGLILVEILVTLAAGIIYAMTAIEKIWLAYIHMSLLAICPVYVGFKQLTQISFCLLEILHNYIKQGEAAIDEESSIPTSIPGVRSSIQGTDSSKVSDNMPTESEAESC